MPRIAIVCIVQAQIHFDVSVCTNIRVGVCTNIRVGVCAYVLMHVRQVSIAGDGAGALYFSAQAAPPGSPNATTVLYALSASTGTLQWSVGIASNVEATYSSVTVVGDGTASDNSLVVGAGNALVRVSTA